MFSDIKYEEINNFKDYLLIDVRSPNEFIDATIPGAVNIPLFDNEERVIIGTVYKEQGPEQAMELGVNVISPKIPLFIKQIKDVLEPGQSPIFFCWRGGMRSKTMATFHDLLYPKVYRLTGGYRAYREYILEQLSHIKIEIPTFVLHGMTGVGKTILLKKLSDMGVAVIDLEGLAGHRGSIFGSIGNVKPANQKTFDSRLYEIVKNINKAKAVVIEAESKRIGKVSVHENILQAKNNGNHILVSSSTQSRIRRIIEDYKPVENKNDIHEALSRIELRLPTEIRSIIHSAFNNNDFYTIVELLLNNYYDPRYQHSIEIYEGSFFEVNSDDLDQAAKKIYNYILNEHA